MIFFRCVAGCHSRDSPRHQTNNGLCTTIHSSKGTVRCERRMQSRRIRPCVVGCISTIIIAILVVVVIEIHKYYCCFKLEDVVLLLSAVVLLLLRCLIFPHGTAEP